MDLLCSQERHRIKNNIIVYYDKGFTLVSPIGEGRAEHEHNTSTEGPALNSKYTFLPALPSPTELGPSAPLIIFHNHFIHLSMLSDQQNTSTGLPVDVLCRWKPHRMMDNIILIPNGGCTQA